MEPDVRYADYHERACSITSWHLRIPMTGASATWRRWGAAFSMNIRANSNPLRAAWDLRWRACAARRRNLLRNPGQASGELYAPSTAEWKSAGVKVPGYHRPAHWTNGERQRHTAIVGKVHARAAPSVLGAERISVKVNGSVIRTVAPGNSYVEIARTWKAGDTVELQCQRPSARRRSPIIPIASR